MEFDNISRAPMRAELMRRVGVALERTAALDAEALKDGERLAWDDGSYCLVQRYLPKAETEGRFEAHRRYADVQIMLRGSERMLCAPAEGLEEDGAFDPDRDIGFFRRPAHFAELLLHPGDYAVFAPWDAHMPSLAAQAAPAMVLKLVWKIPMA